MALTQITTGSIADDAVTTDKLANAINTARDANTAKTTNATHSGEVTGATALTIADNVVDEANLKVSNSPTNGYFLSAQSGNTGGLTWAQVSTDLVADTSPQLGGDLDTNNHDVTFQGLNNYDLVWDYSEADLTFSDSAKLRIGTSNDLSIYHDGTNSILKNETGDLYLQCTGGTSDDIIMEATDNIFLKVAGSEAGIYVNGDGNVELYYNGNKKAETHTNGFQVTNTGADASLYITGEENRSCEIQFLADEGDDYADYSRIHKNKDTGRLHIQNYASGSWEDNIVCLNNDSTELYYNNTLKIKTGVGGDYGSVVAVNGTNGWAGYSINNQYVFMANSGACGLYNDIGNEWMVYCENNGKTSLYHDGTERLYTTSYGAALIGSLRSWGHVYPNANNDVDLGTSSLRWRNIYTNDLNLSNEGGANDVDGTWGSYTIQEGAEDLFLVNKRNGKKYKFNLTEVS